MFPLGILMFFMGYAMIYTGLANLLNGNQGPRLSQSLGLQMVLAPPSVYATGRRAGTTEQAEQ